MSSLLVDMPVMAGVRKGDVLRMPCNSGSTLGDVHTFLKNKLGHENALIFLQERGVLNFDDRDLVSMTFRESMCLASRIPVLLHEGERFPVSVKTLTGRTITVPVHTLYSVLDLKKRIQEVEGIPVDQQRLIAKGRQMINAHRIYHYGLCEESVLHLVLRLRGGGPALQNFSLVDVCNDEARVDIQWSDSAPDWRQVGRGFAIEGMCMNIDCRAFGEDIICNMQFGCFNMHTVVSRCPICYHPVESENLGFNNCFYRIRGVKEGSDIDISMPWTKVGDCYRTWDEGQAGVVEWEYMEIVVRSLQRAKQVPGPICKEAPVAEECAICFHELSGKEDVCMLQCCHSYHDHCWKGWSDTSRSKGCDVTCPLCRVVVEVF